VFVSVCVSMRAARVLLALAMLWACIPVLAGGAAAQQAPGRVRVLVKPVAPFVIVRDDGAVAGFSIELWQALARRMGLESEIVMVGGVSDLLAGVESGRADLGIAAVSITAAREARVDFSHPYFRSGLQIMVPAGDAGLIARMRGVIGGLAGSHSFRLALGALLVLVLATAHVVWLAERRRNPQFARRYPLGLWDGIYWTMVTISTVGYGDKTPKTHPGRVIALVLMVFGYLAFAWFTATIASSMTVSRLEGAISGPGDLPGKTVATVSGSTGEAYLRRLPGVRILSLERVEETFRAIENGRADAVVYDFPVLGHYLLGAGRGRVRLAGPVFQPEPYGIVLPEGSPLRNALNRALLEMMESGEYEHLRRKWFPAAEG